MWINRGAARCVSLSRRPEEAAGDRAPEDRHRTGMQMILISTQIGHSP